VLLALGEFEEAQRTVAEGLEAAEITRNRLESARIQSAAADVHLAQGTRPRALAALEKAADLYSELDSSEELARTYSRIGLLRLEDGDEARARDCLQRATEIIERRRVGGIIAEWDTLQLRLQQRLGQFVDRIEGDGRLRLAGLYQGLALLEGAVDKREGVEQLLGLLRDSLGYRRARLCLAPEPGQGLPRWLGDEDAGPEEKDAGEPWRQTEFEDRTLAGGARLLLQPLGGDGVGLLVLERGGEASDPAERDFLAGLARLLLLALGRVRTTSMTTLSSGRARGRNSSKDAPRLVGRGRDMQRMHQLIERVRDVDTTVLITGESGTGKEEVARAIHFSGVRREKPFLPVNCASIPATLLESTLFGHERGAFTSAVHRHIGVFEEAAGGTVFLDEIGELTADMQAKLLRVLQSMEFTRVGGTQVIKADVRVLTATNRDLEAEVRRGQFREDLFYRINVLRFQLVPLREKREDIPLLVEHFLAQAGGGQTQGAKRLSQEVRDVFQQHPWPGNIRQLRNVIQSCMVLARGPVIQLEDLPDDFLDTRHETPGLPSLDALAELVVASGDFSEDRPLEEALLATLAHRLVEVLGSKAKAARLLGISKPTLYRRLRSYDTLRGRGEAAP
jgi:DNA-binding NtrC family response regulator